MIKKIGRHGHLSGSMPTPAHRRNRRQPLPFQQSKSTKDDSQAPEAFRTILASQSYRETDQDVDFLQGDATRAVRLQLDFLKTESLLQAHGVAHTIVFGGTRIAEPKTACRAVETRAEALATHPNDEVLQHSLAIAQRIAEKSRYYEMARRLGQIVGVVGERALGRRISAQSGAFFLAAACSAAASGLKSEHRR